MELRGPSHGPWAGAGASPGTERVVGIRRGSSRADIWGECSTQREQPVQRPWDGNGPGVPQCSEEASAEQSEGQVGRWGQSVQDCLAFTPSEA